MDVQAVGAKNAFAITPDDDVEIKADALMVTVTGELDLQMFSGEDVTIPEEVAVAGTILPLVVRKVYETSTASVIGLTF